MQHLGKILAGLVIFLLFITSPIWYNLAMGKADQVPQLERPAQEKNCVEDVAFMRSSHMNLLDDWRNSVVRDKNRVYVSSDGKKYEMSLSKTCTKCHANTEQFCDKCHNYLAVDPTCWQCHVQP